MTKLTRRKFLLRSTEAGLVVAAAGLGFANYRRDQKTNFDGDAFAPVRRSSVTVVRATSYDDLESVVLDGIRTAGLDVAGRSVLLKPNLVEYDSATAINTDPRLIGATVLAMRRLGAREVVVGEGPGHRRDTDYVVTESGLFDVLREVEAPFVDLNIAPLTRMRLDTSYTELGELWLPAPVVDADIVVSMPKMKTHHHVGMTLSLKNCFGCVPGRVYGWPKNVLHWNGIETSILDVSAAVRPDFAIVDGIVGMEGNGPIQGTPVDAGVLVFGTDPVAVDATAARMMEIDGERVPYLSEAGLFLGQARLEEIDQHGEDPERSARPFELWGPFETYRLGSPKKQIEAPDRAGR